MVNNTIYINYQEQRILAIQQYNFTPDGVNICKICKICDARFDVKARYNQHFELEHADLDKLTRTELYDLWHKYDDNPYAKFEPEHAHLHEEYDRYLQEKYKNDWQERYRRHRI